MWSVPDVNHVSGTDLVILGGPGRNRTADTRSAVVNVLVMRVHWRRDEAFLERLPPLHEVSFKTTFHGCIPKFLLSKFFKNFLRASNR